MKIVFHSHQSLHEHDLLHPSTCAKDGKKGKNNVGNMHHVTKKENEKEMVCSGCHRITKIKTLGDLSLPKSQREGSSVSAKAPKTRRIGKPEGEMVRMRSEASGEATTRQDMTSRGVLWGGGRTI